MFTRKVADPTAFVVAIVVLLVGLHLVIDKGPSFDAPTKTTTAVELKKGSGVGKKIKTTEFNKPGAPEKPNHKSSAQVERPTGAPYAKRTTTVEASPRSFTERVLGKSGLILLQIAAVVVAAFVAGAFTQRVMVGEFALKLGSVFELSAVPALTDNTKELTAEVAAMKAKLDKLDKQEEDLKKLGDEQKERAGESVKLGMAIVQLKAEIEGLKTSKADK